jgi:serine protease
LAAGMVKAIVTSSGNDGGNSAAISPGNCSGVIAVTAVDRAGSRASYASVGSNVALAAPGGFFPPNAVDGRDGILAISNIGTTTPGNHAFVFAIGTSEAAAHVSGVAALVLSANPSLTADALRTLLRQTARPFPDATCNTMTCGAGIVNAGAAVMAAAPAASAPLASDGGDGGGGGGGGGCTMARGGSAELVLPIAALWALLGIWRRRRMGWRAR